MRCSERAAASASQAERHRRKTRRLEDEAKKAAKLAEEERLAMLKLRDEAVKVTADVTSTMAEAISQNLGLKISQAKLIILEHGLKMELILKIKKLEL